MAYERLDEALRQLKTDRERAEATAKQRQEAGAEAKIRFARIKSGVIGPIFDEVVARLVAEGFFGEVVDDHNDGSGPISLNVNLSDEEGVSQQGSLQVRYDPNNLPIRLEQVAQLARENAECGWLHLAGCQP
jgi:multidrug efflux pump subunit AcrA (membrane-fusion protein)